MSVPLRGSVPPELPDLLQAKSKKFQFRSDYACCVLHSEFLVTDKVETITETIKSKNYYQ